MAERAEELVRLLMELYGAGLERVVALVGREPGGDAINRRMAQDELLASLFVLHELHPVPLEDRVAEALESSGSGGAKFLGLDDEGKAHFELAGGTGCGSHATQFAIEKAVLAVAPEVVGVAFDAPPPPPVIPGPVPVQIGGTRVSTNGGPGSGVSPRSPASGASPSSTGVSVQIGRKSSQR